jgi:hypothetical protein
LALLGYARFYQQVFELLPHEQPTDDVIADDEQLDKWWTNFWNNKKRELAKHMAGQQKQGPAATKAAFSKLPAFKE